MYHRSGGNITIEENKNECVMRVGEKVPKRSLGASICARIAEVKNAPQSGIAIDLGERALSSEEAEKLKKYIEDHCGVKVAHLYSNTADLSRKSASAEFAPLQADCFETKQTLYMRSNVRCGQVVEYGGSVVLIGNLNAGGVIEAGHSVVVLGELLGVANAGLSKDPNSFIYAGSFAPVKVRIDQHSLTRSQIPEKLIGGNVICSLHQGGLMLKEHFDESLSKGCVSFG